MQPRGGERTTADRHPLPRLALTCVHLPLQKPGYNRSSRGLSGQLPSMLLSAY